MYIKKQPASIKRKKQLLLLSAERQGFEPMTLTAYISATLLSKFQIGNETVTIFAGLFVIFTVLTHYTLIYAGTGGLNLLSFVSGFSDITPFILNLLQGTGSVAATVVMACTMQAIISNIVVNMCYALFFSGKQSKLRSWILGGFGCVIAANVVVLFFFYLI